MRTQKAQKVTALVGIIAGVLFFGALLVTVESTVTRVAALLFLGALAIPAVSLYRNWRR